MKPRDWIITASCVAAMLLLGLVLSVGRAWWGFGHLRFTGDTTLPVLTAAAAMLLASFLLLRMRGDWKPPRIAVFGVFAGLLCALYFLHMQTFFYGDGSILVPQVYRFISDGSYDTGIIGNLKSAPLTGLAVTVLMRGIPAIFPWVETATYPFIGLSVLAIALLALVWFLFLKDEADAGLGLLLFMLGSAGAVFLIGYVEYYALTYVLLFGYLLAGERALRGQGGLAAVIVFYVLLLASHYMGLAFLPSLLYLLACRAGERFRRFRTPSAVAIASGGVLLLWFVAYFALGFAGGDSRIVMPARSLETGAGIQGYTLFSGEHIDDIWSILVLVAPVQFAFLIGAIERQTKDERSRPGHIFHILAAVFFLAFVFYGNTSLGLARDWDVAAPLGAVFCCFAYSLLRGKNGIPAGTAVSAGLLAMAFMLPWHAVMLDTDAAVRRFEAVMRLDDRNILGDYALSGYEALRKQYLHEGNLAGELRVTKEMIDIVGYPEHYELLLEASRQVAATDTQECARLQAWVLPRLQRKAKELREQGKTRDYSIGMDDITRLAARIHYDGYYILGPRTYHFDMEVLAKATRDSIPLVMERGIEAYYAGAYAASEQALALSVRRGLRFEKLYGLLAYATYAQGKAQEAKRWYEEGMREHPRSYNIPISYGYAFLLNEDADNAERYLQLAMQQGPPPSVAGAVQAMLQRIDEFRKTVKR